MTMPDETENPLRTADDFLRAAAETMRQRGKEYDSAGGERSMQGAVSVWNASACGALTEREGWLFMLCLKLARLQQSPGRTDSLVDLVAYAALYAESAAGGE